MLANQIIFLRKKARMSQLQLAEKLNVGPSAVGMYEQGRREPAIDTLVQMAKLFGVSLDYLIIGAETYSVQTNEKAVETQFGCPCRLCCAYCNKSISKDLVNNLNKSTKNSTA